MSAKEIVENWKKQLLELVEELDTESHDLAVERYGTGEFLSYVSATKYDDVWGKVEKHIFKLNGTTSNLIHIND